MFEDTGSEGLEESIAPIEEAVLSSGISSIPDRCFDYCGSLEKLVLPEGVRTISEYAFTSSGISDLTIPSTVTTAIDHMGLRTGGRHVIVTDKGVEPTCTSPGRTACTHCSLCGSVITEQKEIPATGHMYGAWKTVQEATVQSEGLRESVCSICGDVRQEKIEKKKRISIAGASVTGLEDRTYTGRPVTPVPVIKLDGKTLVSGKDYTVSCSNNVLAGKATATITGKDRYDGVITKTFLINKAAYTFTA